MVSFVIGGLSGLTVLNMTHEQGSAGYSEFTGRAALNISAQKNDAGRKRVHNGLGKAIDPSLDFIDLCCGSWATALAFFHGSPDWIVSGLGKASPVWTRCCGSVRSARSSVHGHRLSPWHVQEAFLWMQSGPFQTRAGGGCLAVHGA